MRLPIISYLSILAGAAALLTLSGCSTNSRYYGNDGPPTVFTGSGTESAVPKVEPFRAAANRPYTVLGSSYTPMTTDAPLRQRGVASWYGKQFHGNKTSIGEIYDMYQPTAAHPTMPLPSYARVTNLSNGRSIIVRVNDRGPFLHNRIIDLSYAAAKTLGYSSAGTANVEVRRLTWDEIRSGSWQQSSISTTPLGLVGSEMCIRDSCRHYVSKSWLGRADRLLLAGKQCAKLRRSCRCGSFCNWRHEGRAHCEGRLALEGNRRQRHDA